MIAILCVAPRAHARYVVSFYSHGWGVAGQMLYFPHAFLLVRGSADSQSMPIEQSFGFTAVAASPALVFHRAPGEVIDSRKAYLQVSEEHLAVEISDDQYRALMQAIEAWERVKGDPYDLHARNCITFVGEMARVLGLDVGNEHVMDPARFLEDLRARNASKLVAPEPADASPRTSGSPMAASSAPMAAPP